MRILGRNAAVAGHISNRIARANFVSRLQLTWRRGGMRFTPEGAAICIAGSSVFAGTWQAKPAANFGTDFGIVCQRCYVWPTDQFIR